MLTTSEQESNSSNGTCSMPSTSNGAASYPNTRVPKTFEITATFRPMEPTPTIPSVFPKIEWVHSWENCPSKQEACSSTIPRETANMRVMSISATASLLMPGRFAMRMPRCFAETASKLSKPTPNFIATRRSLHASKNSLSARSTPTMTPSIPRLSCTSCSRVQYLHVNPYCANKSSYSDCRSSSPYPKAVVMIAIACMPCSSFAPSC